MVMKKAMTIFAAVMFALAACAADVPERVLEIKPSPTNSRNSEGDFAILKNGNILCAYSRYEKGTGHDHDPANICSRVSKDGGKTWSREDVTLVANEGGMNVMCASFLRLKNGSLALFYLRKNSTTDCRPMMRVSKDEGKTWSMPVGIVPDSEAAYYVLNNARALRLKSGRILLPLARHPKMANGKNDWEGELVCYFSDDNGRTWRRGSEPFKTFDEKGKRVTTQEPGVVELKDGRVLMYARTGHGRQWYFHSSDGGATWTKGEPSSLRGPNAPATIKRLSNGDLFAVWNDHDTGSVAGMRVPMTLAVSKDEGKSWIHRRILEGAPNGCFCYFAACETKGHLLLWYCAHDWLKHARITRVPLAWLYADVPPPQKPKRKGFFAGSFGGWNHKAGEPMEKKETKVGTWTAAPGQATIYRATHPWVHPYGCGVKITGDLTLALPKSAPSDALAFWLKRETADDELRVEARLENGKWEEIYRIAKGTPPGIDGNPHVYVEMKLGKLDKPVTAYRFRPVSKKGVVICDAYELADISANAFFND